MKHILFPLCAASAAVALSLWPLVASPQALPDVPVPVTPQPQATFPATAPAPSDWKWARIQQISDGQPILIRTTSGESIRCRFAGATNRCIFCDPPGSLQNQPVYHFDRAEVVGVREIQPPSDLHAGLLAAMAITGTIIGVAASRNATDQGAAAVGLITAGLVGAIGYPIVQMQSQNAGFGFTVPLRGFGRGAPRPFGLRPPMWFVRHP